MNLADRPQHLYQVGSMSGEGGMALGVAMNTTGPVFVPYGNGAAPIRLRSAPGTMATLGRPTISPPELAQQFKTLLAGQEAARRDEPAAA